MKIRNFLFAAAASFVLLSCEKGNGPDNKPEEPFETTVPKIEIALVDSTETSLTFTLTPSDAREVAYQLLEAGAEIPGAESILSNGTAADTVEADYTVSDLAAGTAYIIVAAARNADTLSEVARIDATTKVEAVIPDPVPVVTLESIAPKRNGVVFSYTQKDAENMAYMIVKSSEAVPGAADILENGTAIDLESETVTAEGLDSYADYILAVAARHGEEYSDVVSEPFTTLLKYYIDENVPYLTFTSVTVESMTNNATDASKFKLVFENEDGWAFETRVYAYLTADGTTLADGSYSVSSSKEAGNIEPGDVATDWYMGSFLEQKLGSSRSENLFGPLTSGTMTVTGGKPTFDFIFNSAYVFKGESEAAVELITKTSEIGSTLTDDYTASFGSGSVNFYFIHYSSKGITRFYIDETGGDAFYLNVYHDSEGYPTGTFTPSDNGDTSNGKFVRGKASSKWLEESTTGLEIRPTGFNSYGGSAQGNYTLAPAWDGSVTVTENGDEIVTLTFELQDDVGHKFSGEYTGSIYGYNY